MNDVDIHSDGEKVERLVRFDSILAGNYCRAIVDIDKHIPLGRVLLIQSVRVVEGDIHTVILRPHPSVYGKTFKVDLDDDSWSHEELTEHRFRLDDFLAKFEYEENHKEIRKNEVLEIQGVIDDIEEELRETQSDPEKFRTLILSQLEENKSDDDKFLPQATYVSARDLPTSLSNAIGTQSPADELVRIERYASQQKELADATSKWMQGKTREIQALIQKTTPFYEENIAASLAAMEDTRDRVKTMMEGVETLKLYLGEDVIVNSMKQGESAPAEVPLTVFANKLVAAEELSCFLDIDKWFDFSDHDKIAEAINEYPAFIDQIFPTERCMFVMATTHKSIDYGNTFYSAVANKKNRDVFLMVRDGENIYQIHSPVESHLGSSSLFPSQDDQDNVFNGIDGTNVSFNDVRYSDKLKLHEIFALHFKRWLVMCAGLDSREQLFGRFYPDHERQNFLSLDFQQKYFVFADPDANALAHERPDVHSWWKEQNSHLRSGSLVYLRSVDVITELSAPGAWSYSQYERAARCNVNVTREYELHVVTKKGSAANVALKLSRDHHFDADAKHTINVDLLQLKRMSDHTTRFLCLDFVTAEDLHYYIHSRDNRIHHLGYMRMFKQALAFLNERSQLEVPESEKLYTALLDSQMATPESIDDLVKGTINHWRVSNRGSSISDIDEKERTSLLKYAYFLKHKSHYITQIESRIQEMGYRILRVSFTGSSNMMVYYEPFKSEIDDRLSPHSWVHKSPVRLNKASIRVDTPKWAALNENPVSESIARNYDGATEWYDLPDVFGSYDRKQKAIALIDNWKAHFHRLKTDTKLQDDVIKAYDRERDKLTSKENYVVSTSMLLPIGLRVYKKHNREWAIRTICISIEEPHLFFGRYREADREKFRSLYVAPYARTIDKEMHFDIGMDKPAGYEIKEILENRFHLALNDLGVIFRDGYRLDGQDKYIRNHPLPSFWLEMEKHSEKDNADSYLLWGGELESKISLIDDELGMSGSKTFAEKIVARTIRIEHDDGETEAFVHDVIKLSDLDVDVITDRDSAYCRWGDNDCDWSTHIFNGDMKPELYDTFNAFLEDRKLAYPQLFLAKDIDGAPQYGHPRITRYFTWRSEDG